MNTALTATHAFPYFSNLSDAADKLIGAIFSISPSEFAASVREARAMSIVAGGEGTSISTDQLQKIGRIAGKQ